MYRKGTTLLRKKIRHPTHGKMRLVVLPLHVDMIQDSFWLENPEILGITSPYVYEWPESVSLPKLVLKQLYIKDIKTEKEQEDSSIAESKKEATTN